MGVLSYLFRALVLDMPTVVVSPAPTLHHRRRRRLQRTAPLFSSFTVEHPHTAVAFDALNALSNAIAVYHNNDRLSETFARSVAPRGTQTTAPPAYPDNHYAERAPSPLLPPALAGMSLSRQTNTGKGVIL